MPRLSSLIPVVLLAAGSASASIVHVHITGSVESNQFTTGLLAGVPANTPVDLRFDVDSDIFLASPTPSLINRVRGYRVINSTFMLTIGGRSVPLQGNPVWYFVIRNDDPGVDGFFFSVGTDVPTTIPVNIGLTGFGVEYSRTFANATTLQSLDVLGAQGTWSGFTNLSVYNFNIARNELVTPCIMTPESITIQAEVPCLADFDGDADVDGDDIIAFFAAWDANLSGADLTGDGGVDADDVIVFFAAWDRNC